MIVFGSRMYGKVDRIDGIGHVGTQFGHLYYVPLIPFASYFITRSSDGDEFGAKVKLEFRSILKTYVQAALIVLILGTFANFLGQAAAGLNTTNIVLSGLVFFASLAALILWRRIWLKAKYERAKFLADDLGFDERLKIFIDLNYEQINDMEADRRLDSISSNREDLANLDDEIRTSGLDHPIS